jgi:hypothetical protein
MNIRSIGTLDHRANFSAECWLTTAHTKAIRQEHQHTKDVRHFRRQRRGAAVMTVE